ncbi:cytochrome c [Candidatus Chloroploca sp. M-50]|uniref:Cytochrome c n=1 Tax=Candidatus Chloroploca mongolica TaxID=2528176 RepID=A0ABS4D5I6_9CHLR|nr:cytochrome c [Candidatus Chloroploca mongolica]MBP1464679.1 cytochrome c [Candidatus Chloroploca mongolica]
MQTLRSRCPLMLTRFVRYGWLVLLAFALTACHQDMYQQPSLRTYEPSSFFEDGRSARSQVPGTVAFGQARTDEYLYTGLIDGVEGDVMPFTVSRELLERGQEQYDIWCSVCHGVAGYGQSMVAQRGGIVPANFHQQRLRDAPIGHFYNIITVGVYRGDPAADGYQSMYSYASRIAPEDRWAIAAYIRALQLSQNATLSDVPPDQRSTLGN